MTEQNAKNLLIGKKNTIDYHFKLQDKYEKEGNGEKFIEKAKFKAENLSLLLDLAQKYGRSSQEVILQLKKMYSSEYFKNDRQIEGFVNLYKKLNLW